VMGSGMGSSTIQQHRGRLEEPPPDVSRLD
jgi:hypothetical protein